MKKIFILVVAPSEKPRLASDGCEDICFSHEKCEKQISSNPSEILSGKRQISTKELVPKFHFL
jgi:hypothetical protein